MVALQVWGAPLAGPARSIVAGRSSSAAMFGVRVVASEVVHHLPRFSHEPPGQSAGLCDITGLGGSETARLSSHKHTVHHLHSTVYFHLHSSSDLPTAAAAP